MQLLDSGLKVKNRKGPQQLDSTLSQISCSQTKGISSGRRTWYLPPWYGPPPRIGTCETGYSGRIPTGPEPLGVAFFTSTLLPAI